MLSKPIPPPRIANAVAKTVSVKTASAMSSAVLAVLVANVTAIQHVKQNAVVTPQAVNAVDRIAFVKIAPAMISIVHANLMGPASAVKRVPNNAVVPSH